MYLETISYGILDSNCYIIGDAGSAAVVDAGANAEAILEALRAQTLYLEYIILTHAHIDHVLNAGKLRDATGAQIVIHEDDALLLCDPALNCSAMFGLNKVFGPADILVKDGDTIRVGGIKTSFIHTPGHTPGSMCVLAERRLFSGDTLFRLGVGRTDLGAGNQAKLEESVRRLMELDDSTEVFPGHGPETDIGFERLNNPFIL
jgi:glyoxylase-like metal-dependent hydrolase (beta-lactamase superfamily II)